ncbi:P-loop containing nucleoside triphosphate hydrolase protein [Periconia macrospinosa]|uniref:P-loop containing nucleoside triphosphate hydrolase protein n=1 Tax=Periconia macrospinosa TaxID=97972 RepID=A0A2V1DKL7_9PLEO|nr:P-loop containing nucleoside triphosphate hydrolase protein [Periconia macrospinosa]
MNLLLRQTNALIRKNLLIVCVRRPVSTSIRALLIPIAIVLLVAYSKAFFASPQHWGVSSPHHLRSFQDSLKQTPGRDIVGFLDNGMKGGDVSSVIDALSKTVRENGKNPQLFENRQALLRTCASDLSGVSSCYGAVEFLSSVEQGTNISQKGTWNYTLRGESDTYGSFADVTKDTNAVEVYLMPFQRAVDQEIISHAGPNATQLPKTMNNVVYTRVDQKSLDDSRTSTYLALCIYAFGTLFTFCILEIVYHMTSFVASERELGMAGLIDTMIPGGSNIRGRLVRQISSWVSFAAIYLPSWIVVGIVISTVVFPKTSKSMPLGFTIAAGLALTSFSLFGSSFFKKSQLSGSIMILIAVIFSVLPQTLYEQTRATAIVLSFLCPTATYTYFISAVAMFEAEDLPIKMWEYPKTSDYDANYRPYIGILWIFLVIHILAFPVLAFFVETWVFSTTSGNRVFVPPSGLGDPTVSLQSFCKTYQPGIFSRVFKRRQNVNAVNGLDLAAHPGQILCLLGPNGSGKSTTMNCIAGNQKVTAGKIVLDPSGGIGYAPQNNVIWPELTVLEHIRIFSDLKCTQPANNEVISDLARMCDLQKKLSFKAKTLSGGQKRKLQLAMTFSGGSAVCCIDEVSTGLDPISRRRIWEILLAERPRRTIIMTTHFLDEADYLADNIVIMHKGSLRAEGTSAMLKNQYGNGYTIKLANGTDVVLPKSIPAEKEGSRHQMVYRVGTASLAGQVVTFLESQGIHNYGISGPTMEELFLKVTGDNTILAETAQTTNENTDTDNLAEIPSTNDTYKLGDGRPISVVQQWWLLFCKRFKILRRRWVPYVVALVFGIGGAAVSPLLIASFRERMECPSPSQPIYDVQYRNDFSSYTSRSYSWAIGPSSKVTDDRLRTMTDTYSKNHTSYPSYSGFSNATQLRNQLQIVESVDEIVELLKKQQTTSGGYGYGYGSRSVEGGIWLGDDNPTVYTLVTGAGYTQQMMNFFNNLASGVPISSYYQKFADQTIPAFLDYKPLIFLLYYGLILAVYPAFFTLYPTNERISNVRSMQYSNGIRPIPLWLSHLAFDGIVVLTISVIAVIVLAASSPVWFGLGYIFFILVLYGVTATLLSYIISMFARSAVTSWFMISLGQVIFYFAYFGGMVGVSSTTNYSQMESALSSLYFGMGIISPVVSLERALIIGLGQFTSLCHGRSGGSIYLFGGPILYLILQGCFLFGLLLWWDSTFKLPSFGSRKPVLDTEATEMFSKDVMAEKKRLQAENTDLRVESVSKSFKKNLAVDNVTFGVQSSEIFALLGPNGAGKSTLISMIRGDLKPSTPSSVIEIARHSILTSPVVARSNLGVCPQFDSADVLTVAETLRFFARIRGVSDVEYNVNTVIAACGIAQWTDQLAQNLSGGTKRKLSLAVALVGNPRVLVLDEPSSALDANAKRTMWKCLQSISRDRAVVLTTHSMEEADALADRIGIVSSRMLALGDREELKRRAGTAYHIHLVSKSAPRTTPEELQVMKNWVANTFADAKVSRETQGGQLRLEVPADRYNLVDLIKMLEEVKGDLGVEFFSVGKATLDEVFENIVRRYGTDVEA